MKNDYNKKKSFLSYITLALPVCLRVDLRVIAIK